MHHDAQWAVIGVAVEGMGVRHLDYRQQRQQNQADNRRHRETSRLGATIGVPFYLQSPQQTDLIFQEYTLVRCPGGRSGYVRMTCQKTFR